MREKLRTLSLSFMVMPLFLKFVTFVILGNGILFVVLPFVPIMPYNINDKTYTFSELWLSGQALIILGIGILCLLVSYAFCARRTWSHHIYPAICVFMLIASIIDDEVPFGEVLIYLMIGITLNYLYFKKKKSVVDYFSVTLEELEQQ